MRLMRIAAAMALLAPAAAWAEPITAVAAVLQIAGYTTAAGVVLLGGAIYGGIKARREARKAQARQRAAYNASLQDRMTSALRSDVPWQIVYGRAIVAGDVLDIITSDKTATKTDGTTYTKADAYKTLVLRIASHECQAINEVYVDGVAVGALDANGWATTGEFAQSRTESREITIAAGGSSTQASAVTVIAAWDETLSSSTSDGDGGGLGTGGYSLTNGNKTINNTIGNPIRVVFTLSVATTGTVRVEKNLGSDTQTTSAVLSALDATRYTSSHRLRGICYIVVTVDLDEPRFQSGIPNITADVSGRKVYDPRSGTTAWSDNAALCCADFISSEDWGFGADLTDADDVDEDALIAAANVCDESITLTVGSTSQTGQARYTCNGSFRSDDSREAVLEDLAGCMAGKVTPSAGWVIQAGAWTAPVMDLTDADLAGLVEVVQSDTPTDDLFNGMRGQLTLLGALSPSDFNPYQNATFAADDGRDLWADITLPYTNNLARARNLCRIAVEENRSGQVIRYPANLRAWPLQVGDRVTVTHSELGFDAKTYRVTDVQLMMGEVPVMLTLQEDDASIWDDADAAIADPTPNTSLPSPWVVTAPTGVALTSTGTGIGNGTLDSRVRVTWDDPADAYMAAPNARAIVRWRRDYYDANNVWQETRVLATDRYAWLSGVRPGDGVTVGVRFRNPLGALSDEVFAGHTVTSNGGASTEVTTQTDSSVSISITSGANRSEKRISTASYTNETGRSITVECYGRVQIQPTSVGGTVTSCKARLLVGLSSAGSSQYDITNTAYDNIGSVLTVGQYNQFVDTDTITLTAGQTVYGEIVAGRQSGSETSTTFDCIDSKIRLTALKR